MAQDGRLELGYLVCQIVTLTAVGVYLLGNVLIDIFNIRSGVFPDGVSADALLAMLLWD